jgi:hypothetical protein
MQTILSKALKSQFHQKLKLRLPDFQKVGTDFGGVIYRKHEVDRGRYIFIFLSLSPKLDRFTIEFAVNRTAEYPFELLPGDKTPHGAARYRIRKFMKSKGDGWWNLNRSHELEADLSKHVSDRLDVSSALSEIPTAIDDAIEQILAAITLFLRSIQ